MTDVLDLPPLFIPLKRQFFEAFERGEKDFEYRKLGPRWNEKTCQVGRLVTLSLGYGKHSRLAGVIRDFSICNTPQIIPGWWDCFGDSSMPAAVIKINILNPQLNSKTATR
jgi:hypothetical protein